MEPCYGWAFSRLVPSACVGDSESDLLTSCETGAKSTTTAGQGGASQLKSGPALGCLMQKPKNFVPVLLVPTEHHQKSSTQALFVQLMSCQDNLSPKASTGQMNT